MEFEENKRKLAEDKVQLEEEKLKLKEKTLQFELDCENLEREKRHLEDELKRCANRRNQADNDILHCENEKINIQHDRMQIDDQRKLLEGEKEKMQMERSLLVIEQRKLKDRKKRWDSESEGLEAEKEQIEQFKRQLDEDKKQHEEEKKKLQEDRKQLAIDRNNLEVERKELEAANLQLNVVAKQLGETLDKKNAEIQQLRSQLRERNFSMMPIGEQMNFEPRVIEVRRGKNLANGGQKDVYEGKFGDKTVAIASFRSGLDDVEVQKLYRREVRTFFLSSRHPNVVQLEGVTSNNELVMEFCPHTLKSIQPSLSFIQKLTFSVDICRGLAFLHHIGVSHGDLKPENILISSNNHAKLSDFGFSFHDVSEVPSRRGGTTRYDAPEIGEEIAINLKQADIYALGGVLLFLFSGQIPWQGRKDKFVLKRVVEHFQKKEDFVPEQEITHLREELKDGGEDRVGKIAEIVRRCFSTDPLKRGSSREILNQLEAILENLMEEKPDPVVAREQEHQRMNEAAFKEGIYQQLVDMNIRVDNLQNMMLAMMLPPDRS
eukprot:TRINITY_DN1899_c0_g1_i1.p1 TRINITY_DN1899_c0_g1~~TRINITY_DN1899_c0_g1_i1.p1  ORF type:complete len:548 (-),score=194.41 TRINITY_DN1899_c0_g1_i1:125-1768(-)